VPRRGVECPGVLRSSPVMDDQPAGLWEQPIPGQLRLSFAQQPIRPADPARTPAPAPPESTSRAAAGGLVLSYQDPDVGRWGALRWYGVHLQERLDGGVDVIRRWGRIGHTATRPHQLADPYPDWTTARNALGQLLARRAARGYQRA